MINARNKGARGEREVLQLFRNAYGGTWERQPIGYAGSDLRAPESFPYAVEIKNQKCDLRHIVLFRKNVQDWWEQACIQAKSEGKKPLLVVKCEREWWCIWDEAITSDGTREGDAYTGPVSAGITYPLSYIAPGTDGILVCTTLRGFLA